MHTELHFQGTSTVLCDIIIKGLLLNILFIQCKSGTEMILWLIQAKSHRLVSVSGNEATWETSSDWLVG